MILFIRNCGWDGNRGQQRYELKHDVAEQPIKADRGAKVYTNTQTQVITPREVKLKQALENMRSNEI